MPRLPGRPVDEQAQTLRLAETQRLIEHGLIVYACQPGIKGHGHRGELPNASDPLERFRTANSWIRARAGTAQRLVFLDVDDPQLLDELNRRAETEQELAWWAQAPMVLTRHGAHLWLDADDAGVTQVAGWSLKNDRGQERVSLRAAPNAGVVGPGSVHVDDPDVVYRWADGRRFEGVYQLPSLPAAWATLAGAQAAVDGKRGAAKRASSNGGGGGGSGRTLDWLLANPAQQGGRTDWLTEVMGKAAIRHHDSRAAYDRVWEDACSRLDPPLDDRRANDARDNIWRRERSKPATRKQTSYEPSNGGLVFDIEQGRFLYWDRQTDAQPFPGNWGMICVGRVGTDSSCKYLVDIYRPNEKTPRTVSVDNTTLSDGRKTTSWLQGLDLGAGVPPGDIHRTVGHLGVRLHLRFQADNPPRTWGVPCAGWHQVTDGKAGENWEGARHWEFVEPDDVRVPDVVQHRAADLYLWGKTEGKGELTHPQTLKLWRMSMDWQEPQFVAVTSAWLCAASTHGLSDSDLRPILSVQAPKGSGKSKGYLAFAIQQLGVRSGWTGTFAVIRDALATVQDGLLLVDEFDNLKLTDDEMRALRMGVDGAAMTKKGQDRTKAEAAHMNSALAVCGENPHPVSGALRERMLRLVMPDASGRTVEREGEQVSQWDAEIVPALQEYGNGPSDSHRGLGRGSRHLVQAVRAAGDRVQAGGGWAEAGQLLQELGGEMRQRAVTKYRWLIWGALVNRELVGEDWLLQEVLGWVTDQLGSGEANDPHAVWAGLQGMLSENNSWTTWEGFARAAKQAKTPVDVLPEVVCIYREGHGWYVRPGAVQNRLSNRRDFVGRKEFERVAGYRVGAALKEAGAIDPVVSIRTASGPKKMPVWVVPEQFIRQFDTAAGREAGDSGDSEELPGV